MTEQLNTVDGRQVLRVERRLAHPPEKVWPAVTEPDQLREWFPAEVRLDPRAGGRITFGFGTGDDAPPASVGEISAYDPPRLIAFNWEDDLFRIELHPDGAGCLLVFTHTFADRAGAASFASGWHICLDGLERLADGRPVDPAANPSALLHESYVEAFGLADGTAETTPDGWRVRFERQLTQPVDEVWSTLTGAGPARQAAIGATPPAGFTAADFPAGPITALDAPTLLEYAWTADGEPAGRIRWELSQGTGHGARLVLVQTGPSGATEARATALTAWRARIEPLARRLAEVADHTAD